MQQTHIDQFIGAMKERGIEFEAGLSDFEVETIQSTYEITFPPDLRQFLHTALPTGDERFPDWRSAPGDHLRGHLDAPVEGLYYDVEHNHLWLPEWGQRPDSMADALAVARANLAKVPRMIPIFGTRFLPDEPNETGNPVFSIHQADIIYYAYDLADYLSKEFHIPNPTQLPEQPRSIRFWSQFV